MKVLKMKEKIKNKKKNKIYKHRVHKNARCPICFTMDNRNIYTISNHMKKQMQQFSKTIEKRLETGNYCILNWWGKKKKSFHIRLPRNLKHIYCKRITKSMCL